MRTVALREVLRPSIDPVQVTDPANTKLISVKLHGHGAVRRVLSDDKLPKPFKGWRGRAGQFVFSRIWCRRGAMAIIPAELDGVVVTNEFPLFTIDDSAIDPRFLIRQVQSSAFLAELDRVSQGASGQNRVHEGPFLQIRISLPALDEQRRIAAILDQADALRRANIRKLELIIELASAIYASATQTPQEIPIGKLLATGALLVHKDGNHGSLYPRADDFTTAGTPFITAKAIRDDGTLAVDRVDYLTNEKASQLRIGWIQKGDVLLSHNASVGKVATYEGELGPALIGTSLTCFRPDERYLNVSFLAAALRAEGFQRQLAHDMSQTTRNQVPITAQRRLTLKWIDPALQGSFATRAEPVDAQRQAVRRSLMAGDELFASLQARAFRDEL